MNEGKPSRRRALMLVFLCAGIFMVYLDSTIVNVALPEIQAGLGGGVTQLQWVVDSYALAFASLLLTSGVAGDIVGRRRLFLLGLGGFTAASVLCALSGSIGMLLAARTIQGAVGSGLIPVSLALVTQLYADPATRAKMIGLWAGVGGLALAAGPVLGGALLAHLGWQSIFWVNLPIGVVSVFALLRLLPDTQHRIEQHIDPLGQLLLILTTGSLTYALIEGNARGWSSPVIVTVLAVAAVALTGFVGWEVRTARPLLPLAFFRNPTFAAACAVNFFGLFGLFGAIFLMTLYLQTINGLSAIQTGVRFLALTVAIMVASAVAPGLAKRFGARATIVAGSLFTTVGLLGLTGLAVGSEFDRYGWSLALLGVGVSLAGAPATIALLATVPDGRAGTASGVSNTFRQVGGVFGVAMAGAVVLRHLRVGLAPAVQALPISGAAKEQTLAALGRGDASVLRGLPAGVREEVTARAAQEFVAGMHGAFAVAAAGGLLSGVVALAYIRAGRESAVADPADLRQPAGSDR
ncbi:MAG: DHA2 family efflux MFS transporter permease subunit [Actinobacteria bacterium]|nr:DHA2 family efflux MFS transporter permease subunit [Actinomycetota bacterium]MBI3688532.1 DHA2 family efflux MFS transporter permease subunit [Actinomycetota bacterium]